MRRIAQQGPAARTVDRDEVGSAAKGRGVAHDQLARGAAVSRVLVKGSAAFLVPDLDHPVPVRLQGAPGGIMDAPEERIHDAAPEEGDRRAGCPARVVRGQWPVVRERPFL